METFIYNDLKKASLDKDITKVKTLGPYAYAMTNILRSSSFIHKWYNMIFEIIKLINIKDWKFAIWIQKYWINNEHQEDINSEISSDDEDSSWEWFEIER